MCCQWRNRQGAECTPWDFWPGNFWWLTRKKEARKKGKCRRKQGKSKGGNGKWEEENVWKDERTLFFFPFVFCFSLFKATEICFGSTKMDFFFFYFAPSEKYACYALVCCMTNYRWHIVPVLWCILATSLSTKPTFEKLIREYIDNQNMGLMQTLILRQGRCHRGAGGKSPPKDF